jgi:hypothetical protein
VSSVWDVETLIVDESEPVAFSNQVESITIAVESDIETVTLTVPEEVDSVNVEVPGMQGAPGLQNVYVQLNDPAVEFGWGMAEKGYIWIEADV